MSTKSWLIVQGSPRQQRTLRPRSPKKWCSTPYDLEKRENCGTSQPAPINSPIAIHTATSAAWSQPERRTASAAPPKVFCTSGTMSTWRAQQRARQPSCPNGRRHPAPRPASTSQAPVTTAKNSSTPCSTPSKHVTDALENCPNICGTGTTRSAPQPEHLSQRSAQQEHRPPSPTRT